MTTTSRVLLAACVSVFMAAPMTADAQTRVGGQVSWADDADIGIGVRAMLPVPALHPQLAFVPSFDLFFPGENVSYWELNANLIYTFATPETAIMPYAGTGLNVARASVSAGAFSASSTDIGLNLLGGVRFPLTGFTPFAEAKVELGGGEQFIISFGALFQVGGGPRR